MVNQIERTIVNETNSKAIMRNILNLPLSGLLVNTVYIGELKVKKEFIHRKWYHFEKNVPLPIDKYFADILVRKKQYRYGTEQDIENLIKSGKTIKHLIIRERGFGDLILLSPVLRKLKQLFPWWEIHVACEGQYIFIVDHNPSVTKAWPLNLYNEVRSFPLQTSLSEYSEQHPKRKEIHRTHIYATKFDIVLGENECKPILELSNEEKEQGKKILEDYGVDKHKPIIGVELRASRMERHWPLSRLKQLIEKLLPLNNVIVFDGHRFEIGMEHPNLFNLTGKTNIEVCLKIMSACHVFLAWDSGLLHAAGAMDIPTIALMGAINHELRTTYYPSVKVFTKKNRNKLCARLPECYSCTKKTKDGTSPCIDFSPDQIFRVIIKTLEGNEKWMQQKQLNALPVIPKLRSLTELDIKLIPIEEKEIMSVAQNVV